MLKLAAFDFDHTIIDVNSDTYIDRLIGEAGRYSYPDEIENLRNTHNWTHRMNGVFEFLHVNHSVRKHEILSCLKEIKIEQSMIDLIKQLKDKSYELIIISDANSVFIEEILNQNGLSDYFSTIYTNKAEFCAENELLKVKPFNETFNKNGELFDCPTKICASNICKGSILTHHLSTLDKSKPIDKHLIYVGDGSNDYCPGLYLNENDLYFVRNNYSLAKMLARKTDLACRIKGNVHYWTSGKDIMEKLI